MCGDGDPCPQLIPSGHVHELSKKINKVTPSSVVYAFYKRMVFNYAFFFFFKKDDFILSYACVCESVSGFVHMGTNG